MLEPNLEMRNYLKTLVHRFLYLMDLDDQLKILKDWQSPERYEAIDVGSYFFGTVSYSFQRTILIELSMMLSRREQKSIIDFLEKSVEHAESINPQEDDLSIGQNRTKNIQTYRTKVQEQLDQIEGKRETISRIEGWRDKFLTHADATFFNKPNEIYNKYPINTEDIDQLFAIISEILRYHYSALFNTDLGMKVFTANGLDAILIHTRAFKRIWYDERLKHLNKFLYTQDKYNKTDPAFLSF
jgi:hypothetical protein